MDVDLDAVIRNAQTAKKRSGVEIIPMVKADAYGLGAVPVARALESVDPLAYGIATIAEGRELRDAGIKRRIIVCSPLLRDEYPDARELSLIPVLGTAEEIEAWARGGGAWELSIDTGMSRAGIQWRDINTILEVVAKHPPEGAFTHFHSAELDDGSMDQQEKRFRDAVAALPARPGFLHTDASAAIVRHGHSEWDAIRPGVFLYGVGSDAGPELDPESTSGLRRRDRAVLHAELERADTDTAEQIPAFRRVRVPLRREGDGADRRRHAVSRLQPGGHLAGEDDVLSDRASKPQIFVDPARARGTAPAAIDHTRAPADAKADRKSVANLRIALGLKRRRAGQRCYDDHR